MVVSVSTHVHVQFVSMLFPPVAYIATNSVVDKTKIIMYSTCTRYTVLLVGS